MYGCVLRSSILTGKAVREAREEAGDHEYYDLGNLEVIERFDARSSGLR